MQTYSERVEHAVYGAAIVVMVLLNPNNTDLAFWRVKPQAPPESLTSAQECTARQLRSVGVVSLQGTKVQAAFKEPLDENTVGNIGTAFAAYVHALVGDSIAKQIEDRLKGDEVGWLEHLHSLPDTRIN